MSSFDSLFSHLIEDNIFGGLAAIFMGHGDRVELDQLLEVGKSVWTMRQERRLSNETFIVNKSVNIILPSCPNRGSIPESGDSLPRPQSPWSDADT